MDQTEKLRREAYRLYQLDWMASHGHSPMDLIAAFLGYLDSSEPVEKIAENGPMEPYSAWENDAGFGGEIWACFDEFMATEYLDDAYMASLLPAGLAQERQCDVSNIRLNQKKRDSYDAQKKKGESKNA